MDEDALAQIELQTALLVRNLEMFRRRSDLYVEVDRAGYLVLRKLDAEGPASIGTLAAALGLDPSTTGRQVNAARAAGLVERSSDLHDLRRAVVRLTPAGVAAMTAVRQRRQQATREVLAGWGAHDLATLESAFTRYNQALVDRFLDAEGAIAARASAEETAQSHG